MVVTAFLERAMPLLRYNLGDIGLIEPDRCPCGRRFRTLRLTSGRLNDRVVLPDGAVLYSDTFLQLAATHPGIGECFVHQDADGLVRVHVVPGDDTGEEVYTTVREKLFALAGGPFPLEGGRRPGADHRRRQGPVRHLRVPPGEGVSRMSKRPVARPSGW